MDTPYPEKPGNPAERWNHKDLTRQETRQKPGRNRQVTRQEAHLTSRCAGDAEGT
jgi:hypothetical protein